MRTSIVCLLAALSSLRAPALHAAPAPRFEDEAAQILDELLRADTQNANENETKALAPILERFRAAGISAEIVESAPGRGNLIARLKATGKPAKKPLLLLAHVDVVPVAGQPWTTPPFTPTEKDGFLQARGVGDDKSMAAAIVATALSLSREHAHLSRDVIVALTAGEETGGRAGVRWLVKNRRELLDAGVALNEGGALLLADDGNSVLYAGVSAAEKNYQSYQLTARGTGGHSSLPSVASDAISRLAQALVAVSDYRFPAKVLPAGREYLALRATHEKPPLSDALRHAATAKPDAATGIAPVAAEDDRVLSTDASLNANIRTTCVATQLQGSPADNVLPTTATAVVNCRILPDETREATQATLQARINAALPGPGAAGAGAGAPVVEVTPLEDNGIAPASPIAGPEATEITQAIESAARKLFPHAPVIHSLSTGATDSRHLRAVGVPSYGISTSPITLAESLGGHGAHGPDERRPIKWLPVGARFLREIVQSLTR